MIPVFEVGDILTTALARFRVESKENNTYTCTVIQSKTFLPPKITFTLSDTIAKYIQKVV